MIERNPPEPHRIAGDAPGLPAGVALFLAVFCFGFVAYGCYQFGVFLFRREGLWIPTPASALIADAFALVVCCLGFYYHTRPTRGGQLRGVIATLLCTIGTLLIVWAGCIMALNGFADIDMSSPELQLLWLGLAPFVAGLIVLALGRHSLPPDNDRYRK